MIDTIVYSRRISPVTSSSVARHSEGTMQDISSPGKVRLVTRLPLASRLRVSTTPAGTSWTEPSLKV